MIVRRKNKAGEFRYQVRVPKPGGGKETVGTFPREGSVAKKTGAKWAEHQALLKGAAPGQGLTVREFYVRWEAQDFPRRTGRQLKAGGHRRYRVRLACLIDEFGDRLLDGGITGDEAFNFALANRGSVDYVRSMFSHARENGLVTSHPFSGLKIGKGPGRRDNDPLTLEQLYALADAAVPLSWRPRSYGREFRALILFAGFTCLRPGEVCGLRWEDVDGARLHVRRNVQADGTIVLPKSNKERIVFLPPEARAALNEFPRRLHWIFAGPQGQMLRPYGLERSFRRVREEAGMPNLVPHELRHFGAHHLYKTLNLPARVVAVQLGHTDGGRLVETLYGHGEVGALEELERGWAVG